MENQGNAFRYFWLTVIVVILVLIFLPKFFLHSGSTMAVNQDQSLSALLMHATIQFPDVASRSAATPSTVPTEISPFLNLQGRYYAGQFLQYASSGIGFYFRYSLPAANASALLNEAQITAIGDGWNILYAATSTQAALLEINDSVKQTVYSQRMTYQNQPDGSVMITEQTLMR